MHSLRNDLSVTRPFVARGQALEGADRFTASLRDENFHKIVEDARRNVNPAQQDGLYLWGKNLTFVPDDIGDFLWLKRLSLSDNQLTFLPDSIGHLTALLTLCASDNRLESVPRTIGALVELRKLALSNNRLTDLPDTIGKLKNLRDCSCANNRLAAIPVSLCDLVKLEELNLAHNRITALPNTIGRLAGLRKLDVRGNPLTTLPDSIADLRNCVITIEGCDIPPQEIRRLRGLLPSSCQLVFPPDLLSDCVEECGYRYPLSRSLERPVQGLTSPLSEIVAAWLPHCRQEYWRALEDDLAANGDLKKILWETLINTQEEEEESKQAMVKAVKIFLQDLERDSSLCAAILARIRGCSGEYGQSRALSCKDLFLEVSRYKASRQSQKNAKSSLALDRGEVIESVPVRRDAAKPKRSWLSRLFGCVKL